MGLFARVFFTCAIAFAVLLATLLLFGPVSGFHHMYQCGVFGYMFLNGEDPDPSQWMLYGFEVTIHPVPLIVSLAVWLSVAWVSFRGVRRIWSS
jgi:hypothetical protein